MKKLVTGAGTFGPFNSIQAGDGHWICDDLVIQFDAVGEATIEDWVDVFTVDPLAYRDLRAAEYPPMADYLDGIVKGDTAQVQAYIDACLAVKAKYPKPE
jgi:hypothetical protein